MVHGLKPPDAVSERDVPSHEHQRNPKREPVLDVQPDDARGDQKPVHQGVDGLAERGHRTRPPRDLTVEPVRGGGDREEEKRQSVVLSVDENGEEEGDQDQAEDRDDVRDGVDVVRVLRRRLGLARSAGSCVALFYHHFFFLKYAAITPAMITMTPTTNRNDHHAPGAGHIPTMRFIP